VVEDVVTDAQHQGPVPAHQGGEGPSSRSRTKRSSRCWSGSGSVARAATSWRRC
jgi:hypothetical protein